MRILTRLITYTHYTRLRNGAFPRNVNPPDWQSGPVGPGSRRGASGSGGSRVSGGLAYFEHKKHRT